MGKPALERIKSIAAELQSRRKIPQGYHAELESRCVILWGKSQSTPGTKTRERKIISREKQAQRMYSEVQEENCHILLPFMLAVSHRACGEFVQMLELIAEFSTFRLDLGTDSRELLNRMAVKNKFDGNPAYIRFIESLFPAGDFQTERTDDFELIQRMIKQRGLLENFLCIEFLKIMFPEKCSRHQSITAQDPMAAQTSSFTAIDGPSQDYPVHHRKWRRIEGEQSPQSHEMDNRWSNADGLHHRDDQTQDRGRRLGSATDSGYDGTLGVDEQRHPPLLCDSMHHSSLRCEPQKLAAVNSLPPSKENREMKYMYTNAPASNISKLPEPFRSAVQNSRQWKWERSQDLPTTTCLPSLFPKDYTQDVSFTIWCGHDEGYRLIQFFGSELAVSS